MKKLQKLVQEVLTERQLITKFQAWVGKDKTPTSVDIDYYSQKNNLTQDEKALLKKTFLPDIDIKKTGPTPDTRFRNKQ